VGRHSTGECEEVVIVFEGRGEMTITGGLALRLGPGSVAYCPPWREHDVTNTGSEPLRYLYVVAAVPSSSDGAWGKGANSALPREEGREPEHCIP
jgi:mannose-6-phosphate isomerase-like protein (cupin superfamily)